MSVNLWESDERGLLAPSAERTPLDCLLDGLVWLLDSPWRIAACLVLLLLYLSSR